MLWSRAKKRFENAYRSHTAPLSTGNLYFQLLYVLSISVYTLDHIYRRPGKHAFTIHGMGHWEAYLSYHCR